MNFGEIDRYIFFGGGKLIAALILMLRKQALPVFIVTSVRHLKETIHVDGNSMAFSDFLKKKNIEFLLSQNVSEDVDVQKLITEKTIGISSGAAWLFKKQFIDRFNGRLVNCHGTRLPQDRGGGGFSWRIMRGEKIGVSLIHQVDEGIDTGKILFFEEYIFPEACRIPADFQKYSTERSLKLFEKFFKYIQSRKQFDCFPQQESFSIYWPRLSTDFQGYIDWSWSIYDIEKFICAFDDPYNGAITFLNGEKIRVKKCCTSFSDGIFHPFQKGIIYRKTEKTLFVATEKGSLLINKIVDDNGIDIFNDIKLGARLYTPGKYLEEAKEYRAVYTPDGLKR